MRNTTKLSTIILLLNCSLLLTACGGGGDNNASKNVETNPAQEASAENSVTSPAATTKLSFDLPKYTALVLTETNAEKLIYDVRKLIDYFAGAILYDNQLFKKDVFEYVGSEPFSSEFDEFCPRGGSFTITRNGAQYRSEELIYLGPGGTETISFNKCGATSLNSGYYDLGSLTTRVEKGYYGLHHWVVEDSIAAWQYDHFGIVDIYGSASDYTHGNIWTDFHTVDSFQTRYTDYYRKHKQILSTWEFMIDGFDAKVNKPQGSRSWENNYIFDIAKDFVLGLADQGQSFKVKAAAPLLYQGSYRRVTDGSLEIVSGASLLKLNFHKDYVDYALDVDGNGDFETSGIVND